MRKLIYLFVNPLTAWALWCQPLHATELPSVSFSHKDWELACDNTRTCRAAGYQTEQVDARPVSMQLVRPAGPSQKVTAQLQIGFYYDEETDRKAAKPGVMNMKINGRSLGTVKIDARTMIGTLSSTQIDALVSALAKKSELGWSNADTTWTVSTDGASAVLLKMDEFQGRVGTSGALLKKGNKPEDGVLPPLPAPVVVAAPVVDKDIKANRLSGIDIKGLSVELHHTVKDDDCELITEVGKGDNQLTAARLSNDKSLVIAQCWLSAYNSGNGYWVINRTKPYSPVLVTTIGSDYHQGEITSFQKGRGLGDCGSNDRWTWDGRSFVHTASSATSMCRLVAPGGAWDMPTLVTNVQGSQPKRSK